MCIEQRELEAWPWDQTRGTGPLDQRKRSQASRRPPISLMAPLLFPQPGLLSISGHVLIRPQT